MILLLNRLIVQFCLPCPWRFFEIGKWFYSRSLLMCSKLYGIAGHCPVQAVNEKKKKKVNRKQKKMNNHYRWLVVNGISRSFSVGKINHSYWQSVVQTDVRAPKIQVQFRVLSWHLNIQCFHGLWVEEVHLPFCISEPKNVSLYLWTIFVV